MHRCTEFQVGTNARDRADLAGTGFCSQDQRRGPDAPANAALGLVGAGLFCQIFAFRFGYNLLIFHRDELRCFLAKNLILNG